MKTTIKITSAMLLSVVLFSCSKGKKHEPELKKQGFFVKTIERTLPADGGIVKSTYGYDEKNRIKEFEFEFRSVTFRSTFTYNDQDLIVRANQDTHFSGSDRNYGKIMEFKYVSDKLVEHIDDGTAYPVTYNAANNSYALSSKTYYWDTNNNLKRIVLGARTRLNMNYLSSNGVFVVKPVQMALAIFSENVGKAISLTYNAAMDNYIFSKNEIGNVNDNEIATHYFTNIRDEQGNIIQSDVKNETGVLIRRYIYTYEMRDVD